jgi:RNA-binding protein YlmH
MQNSDKDVLLARISDAIDISQHRNIPKFVGFLNEVQARYACDFANRKKAKYCLFGGYDEAERVVFCALPEWADDSVEFPIAGITAAFRKADILSHRDFLGTLMSLGIKRESVGDILVGEGIAVIFLMKDISNYVITQLKKVGGAGVTLKIGFDFPLPVSDEYKEIKTTVASARLDAIVSHLIGVSRDKGAEAVLSGRVFVNQSECQNPSKKINSGDSITIRQKGKFIIDSVEETTKKGRIILLARHKGSK